MPSFIYQPPVTLTQLESKIKHNVRLAGGRTLPNHTEYLDEESISRVTLDNIVKHVVGDVTDGGVRPRMYPKINSPSLRRNIAKKQYQPMLYTFEGYSDKDGKYLKWGKTYHLQARLNTYKSQGHIICNLKLFTFDDPLIQ